MSPGDFPERSGHATDHRSARPAATARRLFHPAGAPREAPSAAAAPAAAAPDPAPGTSPAAESGAAAEPQKPDCVVIEAANEFEGLRAEGRWLREHYPGFKKLGQALSPPGEHVYDYIDIETAAGEKVSVCFDITSFFGKL